ncbi:MAG: helix-turn-helix domain-containing protein [Planctomycetota bacterium]
MPRLPHRPLPGFFTQNGPALQIYLARGGCHATEAHWQGRWMSHPNIGFYMTDEPGMRAEDEQGRIWPYRPDAITMIPPWFRYCYRYRPGQAHAYLHVTVPLWPGALLRRLWSEPIHLSDTALQRQFLAWARLVAEECPQRVQEFHGLALAQALLTNVIGRNTEAERALLLGEDPWSELAPALELVDRQLHRPLSVTDLAATLGIGREHCSRLFRRILGQSPVSYIQERRVGRAADLLRSSNDSVDVIAESCGLGSRQHLTRLFKRYFHATPQSWREGR